jgi:hypothetical protein
MEEGEEALEFMMAQKDVSKIFRCLKMPPRESEESMSGRTSTRCISIGKANGMEMRRHDNRTLTNLHSRHHCSLKARNRLWAH